MTMIIARDEVDALTDRYGDHFYGPDEVTVQEVREHAADCRRYAADETYDDLTPEQYLAYAADLDALADRYEREFQP